MATRTKHGSTDHFSRFLLWFKDMEIHHKKVASGHTRQFTRIAEALINIKRELNQIGFNNACNDVINQAMLIDCVYLSRCSTETDFIRVLIFTDWKLGSVCLCSSPDLSKGQERLEQDGKNELVNFTVDKWHNDPFLCSAYHSSRLWLVHRSC